MSAPAPTYTVPKLERAGGRYEVTWPTESIVFAFERERTDRRSGELTAELTVWDGAGVEIVAGVRVNLTSGPARATLAKGLGAQRERGDWAELVEHSIRLARSAIRAGEPAILLRDAPPRPEAHALIDPAVTDAGATIVFGDGGLGKSLWTLGAGIDLHTGNGSVLGLPVAAPRRVLFCDWEWDAAVHRERMASMVADAPDLAYLRCDAPLVDEVERIMAEVRRTRSELLIIDSAAWAAGSEPESSDSAKQFYSGLRRIGLPAIVTAHTPKNGDPSKPFGSVFWHNGARLTWQLVGEQSTDAPISRIGLVCRKHNDAGRWPAPLGWEIEHEAGRTTFVRVNAASIAAVSGKLPIRERTVELLAAGAMTYHEIADELGEDAKVVRVTLDRDLAKGDRSRFVKVPGTDNVYRIGLRARDGAA